LNSEEQRCGQTSPEVCVKDMKAGKEMLINIEDVIKEIN
jgi:hypothetical protein